MCIIVTKGWEPVALLPTTPIRPCSVRVIALSSATWTSPAFPARIHLALYKTSSHLALPKALGETISDLPYSPEHHKVTRKRLRIASPYLNKNSGAGAIAKDMNAKRLIPQPKPTASMRLGTNSGMTPPTMPRKSCRDISVEHMRRRILLTAPAAIAEAAYFSKPVQVVSKLCMEFS
jgi:hypothetical protein